MGFFSPKATCGVCGKEVGMNRYKIAKSNAWCCPACLKKAMAIQPVFVNQITIEELKWMIEPKTTSTGQYDLNTAQGMDAYASEKGYIYAGNKTALSHFLVIQENLLPGEEVLMALAPNSLYNGSELVMGGLVAVVFTNRRLICGQKASSMRSPVKAVNLDNINDIQKDASSSLNALLDGKICIDTLKENICFKFSTGSLDRIFIDVMKIVETYRTSKNTAPVVAPISNADELKKYKELLDMGVITQEEFDAKKKQILGL